jgi:hypothetical protein
VSPLPLWRPKSGAGQQPIFLVGATVSGGLDIGDTLVCEPGGVAGDFPVFPTYQWQRDTLGNLVFNNLIGETASTLLLETADVGSFVLCRVTLTNGAGSTVSVSNRVGPIVDPAVVVIPPVEPPVEPGPGPVVLAGVGGGMRSIRGVKRRAQWRLHR